MRETLVYSRRSRQKRGRERHRSGMEFTTHDRVNSPVKLRLLHLHQRILSNDTCYTRGGTEVSPQLRLVLLPQEEDHTVTNRRRNLLKELEDPPQGFATVGWSGGEDTKGQLNARPIDSTFKTTRHCVCSWLDTRLQMT
jgi:hypothetical protein